MSANKLKSILQELNEYVPEKDRENVIEARASHIIESAINLIEEIESNYSEETAKDMERKFLNSIRSRDRRKFSRVVRRVKNSEEK